MMDYFCLHREIRMSVGIYCLKTGLALMPQVTCLGSHSCLDLFCLIALCVFLIFLPHCSLCEL